MVHTICTASCMARPSCFVIWHPGHLCKAVADWPGPEPCAYTLVSWGWSGRFRSRGSPHSLHHDSGSCAGSRPAKHDNQAQHEEMTRELGASLSILYLFGKEHHNKGTLLFLYENERKHDQIKYFIYKDDKVRMFKAFPACNEKIPPPHWMCDNER